MPLGKYYCDYCDKEFQDTPFARKRHLQGLQHLRAKALWYDSFKGIVYNHYIYIYLCVYIILCLFDFLSSPLAFTLFEFYCRS